jgi:hypothetical protein
MLLGHFKVEAAVICAALRPWGVCGSPAWAALVASVALSAELACDAFGTINPLAAFASAAWIGKEDSTGSRCERRQFR